MNSFKKKKFLEFLELFNRHTTLKGMYQQQKKMSNLGFAKLVSGFDVSEIALQVMHTFLLSFKDQYVKCVYFKYVHQIGLKYANWRMTNLSLL